MDSYQLPSLENFKTKLNDKQTSLIVLKNNRGMEVALTNYGARIVSLLVPNKAGTPVDVVLGFKSIADYLSADEIYHGATIGRFANRIKNGSFELNGKTYHITPNDGSNALHGGKQGFHNQIWDDNVHNASAVTFYYSSPDGEEGFPGNLTVSVNYTLTDDNELKISYQAQSDADTHINLTNHAYFNLNGEGSGDVLHHLIQIDADEFLPINSQHLPTGQRAPVANSPFDFRQPRALGSEIEQDNEQLVNGDGYDHAYVIQESTISEPTEAASALAPESGIQLIVYTTEPGVQFYTGNALSGKDHGKSGKPYAKRHAFCFETQHFPDSPNQASFPSTLLAAGKTYTSQTIYRFKVIK